MFGPKRKVTISRRTTVTVKQFTATGEIEISDSVTSTAEGTLDDIENVQRVLPQLTPTTVGIMRQQLLRAVDEATLPSTQPLQLRRQ